MFEVEYFTLTASDATNRYVDLSGTPVDSSNVAMDIISGTAQLLTDSSGDFGVDSTRIVWDTTSYNLYDQLGTGDKIRIIYDRS